ncbi:hypothetical protein [Paracoccus ravus]|uniref:hypothetical protein n=1 Tax=Paracoccus ravus TaxID=2447760 RepID=UPI00106E31DD|nr:hypothetical protein [Paracoccus ravus]
MTPFVCLSAKVSQATPFIQIMGPTQQKDHIEHVSKRIGNATIVPVNLPLAPDGLSRNPPLRNGPRLVSLPHKSGGVEILNLHGTELGDKRKVVRRISGRNSHPDFHRVHAIWDLIGIVP